MITETLRNQPNMKKEPNIAAGYLNAPKEICMISVHRSQGASFMYYVDRLVRKIF